MPASTSGSVTAQPWAAQDPRSVRYSVGKPLGSDSESFATRVSLTPASIRRVPATCRDKSLADSPEHVNRATPLRKTAVTVLPSSAVGGHTNALIMVLTWGNACRAGRGRVSTPWPVLLGAVLG